jgi:hypothetical protein
LVLPACARRRDWVAEIKAEIGDSKVRDKLKQFGYLK